MVPSEPGVRSTAALPRHPLCQMPWEDVIPPTTSVSLLYFSIYNGGARRRRAVPRPRTVDARVHFACAVEWSAHRAVVLPLPRLRRLFFERIVPLLAEDGCSAQAEMVG
jgi:hypothetical protein